MTDTLPALRALIADDERLLRQQLLARLGQVWPNLQVVGQARDGQEALELTQSLRPDVVFLDIRMPGLGGIEAAREIVCQADWRGEVVFVTAFDEYAVAAFEQGAIDYLLKPVEAARLLQTAQRIVARRSVDMGSAAARETQAGPEVQTTSGAPAEQTDQPKVDALLARLHAIEQHVRRQAGQGDALKWIQCPSGSTTRLVAVQDVLFFRSDEKYTRVQTADYEGLIRTPIRDLIVQLDPDQFWQIHRSTVVNLAAIDAVVRDDAGRLRVRVRSHGEQLEVSRGFAHLFRQG